MLLLIENPDMEEYTELQSESNILQTKTDKEFWSLNCGMRHPQIPIQ